MVADNMLHTIMAHHRRSHRSRDLPAWRSARLWRWVNLVLAIVWVAIVPISIVTGWIYSVAFISAVSIYANFVSHIAGWRADEPPNRSALPAVTRRRKA